jgi:aconitate hydratase
MHQGPARQASRALDLGHGDVVIAAITSCTNTSNPSVLGRGRPRRAARRASGAWRPSPGSRPASRPAPRSSPIISTAPALAKDLNALGFDLVGYGCTTCIGNSGPLPEPISKAIHANDLVAASVCRATAISKAA